MSRATQNMKPKPTMTIPDVMASTMSKTEWVTSGSMVRVSSSRISLSMGRARYAYALATCSAIVPRSEEHTSELQSRLHLVCRLLLEKKKQTDDLTLLVLAIVDGQNMVKIAV